MIRRMLAVRTVAFAVLGLPCATTRTVYAAPVSVETIRKINNPGVDEFPHGDLEKDPKGAVEAIRSALLDSDETVRRTALRLADDEKFRSQSYIGNFKRLAKDSSERVRSDLISTLSDYGAEGDKIVYAMFSDKTESQYVRGKALDFLQRFRPKEAIVQLANEVIDGDSPPYLRLTAAEFLLENQPDKARAVAREYINIPNGAVNSKAMGVISKVGDETDLERFKAMRDDPKLPLAIKLAARDAARVLSVEMLPTQKDRVARLEEIVNGPDRTEALWAVSELMSRHDEYSIAVLKAILNDRKHPGYWRVKNSGYFPNK